MSEAGRFDGAYEIACIKHTGRILDYENASSGPLLYTSHSRGKPPNEHWLRPVVFGYFLTAKSIRRKAWFRLRNSAVITQVSLAPIINLI